jgi:hypothetical protein
MYAWINTTDSVVPVEFKIDAVYGTLKFWAADDLMVSVVELRFTVTKLTPAVAVAVNATVLPAPATAAWTVFVPGVEPSLQLPSVAMPLVSVVRTTVEAPVPPRAAMLPPPPTWNFTVAFAIGCGAISSVGLPRSITRTDGGAATRVPDAAV